MKTNFSFKIVAFLLLSYNSFGQLKNNYFTIDGIIRGKEYSGYLYLSYNNIKDSCLVINNKFNFKGYSPDVSVGYFTTNQATVCYKDFYLENENIKMDISIEKKIIDYYEFDWLIINSISGTQTSLIEKEYEDFKYKYQHDTDWQEKHYHKLDEIISRYPNHIYSSNLLLIYSRDSLADIKKVQKLYNKLDVKSLDYNLVLTLKRSIFPINSSKVGKQMLDFELPNGKDELINTKDYRGSILLLDFWAS
ncbi:MAG TPA: hypothetical protein DDZ41_11605, partial [Flavobacterium sp.]|nr:hypothetical protein [Flavobacterium sp.]